MRFPFPVAAAAAMVCFSAGCGRTYDPTQAAARAVIESGGQVTIRVGEERLSIRRAKDLPEGPIEVEAVTWTDYPGDENSKVDDAALAALAPLTELVQLDLSGTAVTDQGLIDAPPFPKLRRIALANTEVTNAVLSRLASWNLESATLVGTRVTEAGVAKLRQALPQCDVRL